jgi:flagellar motility protein MotE (MotC chaperone)
MNETVLLDLARNGSLYGVWTLVIIALVTLIKGWPALRKMSLEADGSLRKDLFARIHELEEQQARERTEANEALREVYRQLETERAECNAKLEELRDEIIGLHRQMTTTTLISGETIAKLPPATAASVQRQAEKGNEPS